MGELAIVCLLFIAFFCHLSLGGNGAEKVVECYKCIGDECKNDEPGHSSKCPSEQICEKKLSGGKVTERGCSVGGKEVKNDCFANGPAEVCECDVDKCNGIPPNAADEKNPSEGSKNKGSKATQIFPTAFGFIFIIFIAI